MPAAVGVLPRHRRQGLGRCGVDAAAASREMYRRDLGAQGFRVVLLEYILVVSTKWSSTRPVRFLLLSHTGSWHAGGASGTDGCALAKLGSWTRIRWQETLYGCRLAQPLCGCLARDAWRGPAVVHQEAGQVCV